uniref:hypothetical protein n=1 Tax=Clostridium sp. NkU-1 TaxID=1095009 RepID=UPI0006D23B88
MKSGTYRYQIELIAPLGARNGEIKVQLTGNEISGEFAILGNTSAFAHGCYEAGIITVSGKLKTLMYSIPYELIGEMGEEAIRFEMQTSKGVLSVSGTICGQNQTAQ